MKPSAHIQIKRIYDPPAPEDGCRLLVDRLWPRGIAKANAPWDEWDKQTAPSTELRQWFNHDPAKWEEFRKRYVAELGQSPEAVRHLQSLAAQGPLTLLYAARDTEHNEAAVLKDYLLAHADSPCNQQEKQAP